MAFGWDDAAVLIGSAIIGAKAGEGAGAGAERAAEQQLEFSKQLYADYQEKYGPIEDELISKLFQPVERSAAYRAGVGEIERGIGTADAALRRRFAVTNPYGSNLEAAFRGSAQYTRAPARASLYSGLEQSQLAGQQALLATGRGVSGPAQTLAGTYATRTGYAAQNAATAGQSGANLANNLTMLYMLTK